MRSVALLLCSLLVCGGERVFWDKVLDGECNDARGRVYPAWSKLMPPRMCFQEVAAGLESLPPKAIRAIQISVGGLCRVLVDAGVPQSMYFKMRGFHFYDKGKYGHGPVGWNHSRPFPSKCFPQIEQCNVDSKTTGLDFTICPTGDIAGRNPSDGCDFYPCSGETDGSASPPVSPPPPSVPAACQCDQSLLQKDFPGTDWETIPWYCAKITNTLSETSCRPMKVVSTTGLPTGNCDDGWLECPGSIASSALDPVNLGARCGCSFYSTGATPFESKLCVDPIDTSRNNIIGKSCTLPSRTGSCPGVYVPCDGPRVPSIQFNTTLNALNQESPGWEWRIKSRLGYVMDVDIEKVMLISICPKSACPTGGCPTTRDALKTQGCVWIKGQNNLVIPPHLQEVEFYLGVDIHASNEAQRSVAVAQLMSVYMYKTPANLSLYLDELAVDGVGLAGVPVQNTGGATEGHSLFTRTKRLIPMVGGAVLVVLAIAIVVKKVRGGRRVDEGLDRLREQFIQEMKPVVGKEVGDQPRQMLTMPPAVPPPVVYPTTVNNITAIQINTSKAIVEEWRTNRVMSIADRDPTLPLGESSDPPAPIKTIEGHAAVNSLNSNSSDLEMAI